MRTSRSATAFGSVSAVLFICSSTLLSTMSWQSAGVARRPHPTARVDAVATASTLAVGCGRRATPADCQLIVDKSVELQMKSTAETDPKAVAEREVRIRAALGDQIKVCETRRVTDKTIACVQAAAATSELEQCLH